MIKASKATPEEDQSKNDGRLKLGFAAKMMNHRKSSHALKAQNKKRDDPILDSGASENLFCDEEETVQGTYKSGSKDSIQLAAEKSPVPCDGHGTLEIEELQLKNSFHVSSLNGTLVSVGRVCDQGKSVLFTAKSALVIDHPDVQIDKNIIDRVLSRNEDGLYSFKPERNTVPAGKATVCDNIEVWHNRLIHTNEKLLNQIHKHSVDIPKLKGKLIVM